MSQRVQSRMHSPQVLLPLCRAGGCHLRPAGIRCIHFGQEKFTSAPCSFSLTTAVLTRCEMAPAREDVCMMAHREC